MTETAKAPSDEEMISFGWRRNADGAWERPGYDALWLWFELSYASFCVLPRAFMHEMPDEWQAKMAALLNEWDESWRWDGCGIDGNTVCLKKGNRFIAAPDWLINYRHPDHERIRAMRRKPQ